MKVIATHLSKVGIFVGLAGFLPQIVWMPAAQAQSTKSANSPTSIQYQQGGPYKGIVTNYFHQRWSEEDINFEAGELAKVTFEIAAIDLNSDGQDEVIAIAQGPGMCGTGGCSLDILEKISGKWRSIYAGYMGHNVFLGVGTTNGYRNLSVAGWKGQSPLTFDGKKYS